MTVELSAAVPAVTLDAAKAYLRLDGNDEDALLTTLVTAATGYCEAFIGQLVIARDVTETIRAQGEWQRLSCRPVRNILGVDALPASGPAVALPAGAYAVDIDGNGDGWMRVTQPAGATRVAVRYGAGIAADVAGVPDALRQGIVRLAAHLHAHRDDADLAGPPAAVTALWRPWRRMRLR